MYRYIIKRLLLVIPTLFGAAVLVFVLLRLIPGDMCELRLAGTGGYFDPSRRSRSAATSSASTSR